jgi:hypothetical protein
MFLKQVLLMKLEPENAQCAPEERSAVDAIARFSDCCVPEGTALLWVASVNTAVVPTLAVHSERTPNRASSR